MLSPGPNAASGEEAFGNEEQAEGDRGRWSGCLASTSVTSAATSGGTSGRRPRTGCVGDRRTVDRAVRGKPVAVEEVLRAIRPGSLQCCRARLGGAGYLEADDVAQVLCVVVYQSLPRYQDQGVPFTAWLYRIAARKVVDAQRTAMRYVRAAPIDVPRDVPDQAPGPEQQVEFLDLTLRMYKLLDHLPDIPGDHRVTGSGRLAGRGGRRCARDGSGCCADRPVAGVGDAAQVGPGVP
jgi:RNA polymerase sigma factor (sigma-70 family)